MTCDILIIGSGIAGLTCAIKIAEKREDISIVILTKEEISTTNTELAQGGIAAVMNLDTDSFESHIQDTLNAGGGLSKLEIVRHVIEKAPERILDLINWGVEFSKDSNGNLQLGLEGGHEVNRIIHANDQTGKEVEKTLVAKAQSFRNVKIYKHFRAIDLISQKGTIQGVKVLNLKRKRVTNINSKITVLATGGSAQVYKFTTNPTIATGDGVAMAHRVGAKISNMEYFQFHPTAFKENDKNPLFLISEAVRGFGAFIINEKGERFIFKSDSRGELATRDIVAKSIIDELMRSEHSEVFMDCRHLCSKAFKKQFPFIIAYCESKGFNLKNKLLPIIPAAHYQCGGIEVDQKGRTSIHNLFAIGECSNTGLHGKNRLASNSLLEALVFAHVVAQELTKTIDIIKVNYSKCNKVCNAEIIEGNLGEAFIRKIQITMSKYCAFACDKDDVKIAVDKLKRLKKDFLNRIDPRFISIDQIETNNLFEVAILISNAKYNDF